MKTMKTMTEISIRDYTTEGSLVYYSIKIGDWEIDDQATTLPVVLPEPQPPLTPASQLCYDGKHTNTSI
jgi:hypothetical protein